MSMAASDYNSPLLAKSNEYDGAQYGGAILLGLAGILTICSILFLVLFRKMNNTLHYAQSHIHAHFVALLFANVLQGVGSTMNFKWVAQGGVYQDSFCIAQAAIKQTGNLGTAFMSLSISLHLFIMLFLRKSCPKKVFYSVVGALWTAIILIVVLGPTVIYQPDLGPYFGISGSWCWITAAYPAERIYLEYFFEFLSAGLCFLLYLTLLLRLRGNLVILDGRWRIRNVSAADRWQLSTGRDLLDSSMLNVAKCMMWFPIVYALVIVPIAAARLSEFSGDSVPYGATIFTSVVFNLTGFFNVLLLLWTRKAFPEAESIPRFSTRRQELRASMARTGGLVPFTLEKSDLAEEYDTMRQARRLERMNSQASGVSATSTTRLVKPSSVPLGPPSPTSPPSPEIPPIPLSATATVSAPPNQTMVQRVGQAAPTLGPS